ncbi:N-formylglutamate deformylase [Dickeya fangzhongdai]|uniref:N-formylglutamate deformylase n=1 Tax=Dickeya fangzhongdai TaxID=1778540 RepID=A0A2K8QP46_9GAMM|nr:N-formylglutamate deformylase [Dickeya fangzhongdai]ATZ95256.1 N-formylglutamate deformylase [Dickeya fangzhongdai]QOH48697.1 N-formylglutamate deformylase [Dickeya fangzhongdai]QOH53001.1 N-formylglutamate deformylase [Dickeya fangzhongdai]WOX99736.1 N-formylglutamate deformylase [Dickeya fangzhongdai]WOY05113.1 N-formylglutamate deformylase [Dickeya fangzhongdai]
MTPFTFIEGDSPLLLSIPHAGTDLTPEVADGLSPAARPLSDTDWHIPQLYDFARGLGASVLAANYSRFVIDLNRPADDQPLYTTATTGLFPDVLFDGTPAFLADRAPSETVRAGYLRDIWQPYHQQIQQQLARIKQRHGYALLFDAHSIASRIPRLFDGQLPDLNLGTNGGLSSAPEIEAALLEACQSQYHWSWVLNGRFRGGYITRAYGQPEQHQYALQLELAQCNYMSEQAPFAWQPAKARELQPMLERIVRTFMDTAARLHHG